MFSCLGILFIFAVEFNIQDFHDIQAPKLSFNSWSFGEIREFLSFFLETPDTHSKLDCRRRDTGRLAMLKAQNLLSHLSFINR